MTFESFTFKPNPKKVKEDNMHTLTVVGGIVLFLLTYIFLFRGLLAIVFLGGMSLALLKLRIDDIKKKGANRLGSLVEKLTLTRDRLKVGDEEFIISDLEKFEIDAQDYLNKSGDLLGASAGTDNFIEFTRNGTPFSFQFQVKRWDDLRILSEIEREIKAASGNRTLGV